MAAPEVSLYINTGSEGSPSWTEVATTDTMAFGGTNTTSGSIEKVTAPAAGLAVAPELWAGSVSSWPAGTFNQCATYGSVNTNQYVLKVSFATNPTSTAPILTYYDDVDHGADPDDEMATGTSGTNNTGFLKAIETTDGQPAASWCSGTTGVAGASTINCLDGDQSFVQCAAAATAGADKYFNMCGWLPSDATAGTAEHDGVLSVKYTHT